MSTRPPTDHYRQHHHQHNSALSSPHLHFQEYLDVVPSDIAAGIVLLYHKQRQRWSESSSTGLLSGGGDGYVRSRESSSDFSADDVGDEARGGSGGVARVVGGGEPPCVHSRSAEHTDVHRVSR